MSLRDAERILRGKRSVVNILKYIRRAFFWSQKNGKHGEVEKEKVRKRTLRKRRILRQRLDNNMPDEKNKKLRESVQKERRSISKWTGNDSQDSRKDRERDEAGERKLSRDLENDEEKSERQRREGETSK